MSALSISLFFGIGVTLAVWIIVEIFRSVPAEDRQYLDRPPIGFRLIWPFVQLFVFHMGRFISEARLQTTLLRLKNGGVEYSVSPRQFVAAKYISAAVFSFISVLVLSHFFDGLVWVGFLAAMGGYCYPDLWLKELTENRAKAIVKELPFYLDIITLSVEAGSNLTGGLTHAVQKTGDSELRKEFSRVLRDIRSGKTRAEALKDLSERTGSPAVSSIVSSLVQAEKSGASLAPILRAQAQQLRSRRFQMAEKKAMEAPVKMLGPLVIFIFPTTSFVIGFILLSKAIQEGLVTWKPLLWAYGWPA